MTDRVVIETFGFDKFEADLGRAVAQAQGEVRKVVAKGSNNIKTDWRRRWTGLDRLPHLPRSIGYDVTVKGSTITGEIGPEAGKLQAAIAPVVEYGSINSAPHPGGRPALDAEQPRFVKALEDLAVRLVDGNA